jgi:hypothetical protein
MRELFLSNLIGTGKKRFGIYFDGNAFEYYQLKKPKKNPFNSDANAFEYYQQNHFGYADNIQRHNHPS